MYWYCWKKIDVSHSWESISVGLLGWKGVYFVCLFSSPFSKETPQGIVGLFKDRTASWWSRLSWFAFPSTFSLYSLNICVTCFDLFAGSFLRRLNLLRLRWNTCQHLCLSLEITQFPVLQKTSPSGSVSAIVIQRISPIIHLVCPLTFCITGPFSSFLLAITVVERNWSRCLCKRLEGKQGVLREMCNEEQAT